MSYYGQDGPGPAADPWEHSAAPVYDVDLGYPQPPKEPANSRVLLVVLVSVLVVVLCGGGVTALYLIGGGKGGQPTAGGSATPQHSASAATASPSLDPNTILKGQCLINNGSDDAPDIHIVGCGPGTLKVLSKIDATSDKDKCKTVPGADRVYFYKTTPESLSFVLCLQALS